MEWFKFDHDWILVEEEMTYYNHLKDIGSYTTISITSPSSIEISDLNTKLINLGVNVGIRLPALAFNMYYCYSINGKIREDQCQKIDEVGTSSFKSRVDLTGFEGDKLSIEANLMVLRSELLNSFCVRDNVDDCSKHRELQREYPLNEDIVPVSADIFEAYVPSLPDEL